MDISLRGVWKAKLAARPAHLRQTSQLRRI